MHTLLIDETTFAQGVWLIRLERGLMMYEESVAWKKENKRDKGIKGLDGNHEGATIVTPVPEDPANDRPRHQRPRIVNTIDITRPAKRTVILVVVLSICIYPSSELFGVIIDL